MIFWDDFMSKRGFGDGDNVPPDAVAVRYVYVREINRLAAKLGSKVRLIAFDGSGIHNNMRIHCVNAVAVAGVPELDLCKGEENGGYVPQGRGMEEAVIDEAMAAAVGHYESGAGEDLDEMAESDCSIAW